MLQPDPISVAFRADENAVSQRSGTTSGVLDYMVNCGFMKGNTPIGTYALRVLAAAPISVPYHLPLQQVESANRITGHYCEHRIKLGQHKRVPDSNDFRSIRARAGKQTAKPLVMRS